MTADAAHVAAVAEALREHDVFERRSDLTAVCMCGFDFDPLHFGDPWNDHLATVAVETLTPLIRAQVAAEIAAMEPESWACPDGHAPYAFRSAAARIAEGTP